MARRPTRRKMMAVGLACALVAAGCSEKRADPKAKTVNRGTKACGDDLLACAAKSSLGKLVPAQATKATGAPIKLGMINQENTPIGSFPELSQAVQAGIQFVNHDLGGVDGRPIQMEVCNTKFTPEGSTGCAQKFVEAKVPVVLGGIDVFGTGVTTLADNDIPFVGGIPVSTQSVTSPNSYQWSGGTWGATVAFATYSAKTLKAKKVSIVYGEFGSITDSAKYGERTLKKLGVPNVQLVPYPITAADLTAPIQAAAGSKPDAVFILAADTACKPAFDAAKTAGITGKVFFVGACAVPKIIADAGPAKTNGRIFNVEGPINRSKPDPDTTLYTSVVDKYGKGLDPIGAGTVSFRSFMNLYRVLRQIGGDKVTSASITKALEAQRNAPSFMGHTSSCDHKQMKGLPALCSPQQILAEMRDGDLTQLGTWIDVGKVYGDG